MRRFAREHGASADEIDALVAAHKPAHAVAALHRLKGAANVVGASALARAAQAAEDRLMGGDAGGLEAFRAALRETIAHCAEFAQR
jgi:HPt (histidine-containing phosphotransfer) domain-containing protein